MADGAGEADKIGALITKIRIQAHQFFKSSC